MLRQRPQEDETAGYRSVIAEQQAVHAESPSVVEETLETMVWENPLLAKELRAGKKGEWVTARTRLAANARKSLLFGTLSGGLLLTFLYSKLFPALGEQEISMTWRILLGILLRVQGSILVAWAGGIGGEIQGGRGERDSREGTRALVTPKSGSLGTGGGGWCAGLRRLESRRGAGRPAGLAAGLGRGGAVP